MFATGYRRKILMHPMRHARQFVFSSKERRNARNSLHPSNTSLMQHKCSAQAGSSSLSSSLIPLVAGEPRARFPPVSSPAGVAATPRHAAVPYNVGGGGEGRCPQSRFRSQLRRSCLVVRCPQGTGRKVCLCCSTRYSESLCDLL